MSNLTGSLKWNNKIQFCLININLNVFQLSVFLNRYSQPNSFLFTFSVVAVYPFHSCPPPNFLFPITFIINLICILFILLYTFFMVNVNSLVVSYAFLSICTHISEKNFNWNYFASSYLFRLFIYFFSFLLNICPFLILIIYLKYITLSFFWGEFRVVCILFLIAFDFYPFLP